jgi:hypothetical protein
MGSGKMRLRALAFCGTALLGALTLGCLDEEARGVTWSPDGSALAWVQSGEVRIQDFDEESPGRMVVSAPPPATDELAWMPDSQALIATSKVDAGDWDLVRISRTGEVSPEITGAGRVAAPIVDPGARLIIHAEFHASGADIAGWLDGESAPLVSRAGDQLPLTLSDDGRHLVYLSHEGGQADLWVHDFELGLERRLTDDPATETIARWLPRSSSVAYAAQRGPRASLWVVDVADPEPDRLWRGREVVTDLAWAPSGHEIFFCAGGALQRVSDRGRHLSEWQGPPLAIHDLDISPTGQTLALAGEGEPMLLGVDWDDAPRPASGMFEDALVIVGGWAERQSDAVMRGTFERWIEATPWASRRARVHQRFAEALAAAGDHEVATDQLAMALQSSMPPDPELHRLIGLELLLHRRDYRRARVAMINYQRERERTASPDELPLTPLLPVQILGVDEERLVEPSVLYQLQALVAIRLAAEEERWPQVAETFSLLSASSPELRESLMAEGVEMLSWMATDPHGNATSIITLGQALLPMTQETGRRREIERTMVEALWARGRAGAAESVMAQASLEHGGGEMLDDLLEGTFRALIEESLQSDTDDTAVLMATIWSGAELSQALDETASVTQRLEIAGVRAIAAARCGDREGLARQRHAVQGLTEGDHAFDPPEMPHQVTCLIELLWGLEGLRAEDWAAARDGFNGVALATAQLIDAHPETLTRDEGMFLALAMMAIERRALLDALDDTPEARRALRSDAALQGPLLWSAPLPCGLPLPGTPRLRTPDFHGAEEAMLDRADELAGRAEDQETPALRDHLRIGQARALAAAGDSLAAMALLRQIADETSVNALARAALWHLASIHRALGDPAVEHAVLDRFVTLDPTDLEWEMEELIP